MRRQQREYQEGKNFSFHCLDFQTAAKKTQLNLYSIFGYRYYLPGIIDISREEIGIRLLSSRRQRTAFFAAMALVPNIVDQWAQDEPERLYAEYPVSTLSYEEGYRKITYADFANAVNGVAWWLHNTLGPGRDFQTLAYIGPNDLRYPALILGAAKAGYIVKSLCVQLKS